MRRSRKVEDYEVPDVPDRLSAYAVAPSSPTEHEATVEADLFAGAVTLLPFLPRNQPREKVEKFLCPNDQERGRRVVDALIKASLVTEDGRGRLSPGRG